LRCDFPVFSKITNRKTLKLIFSIKAESNTGKVTGPPEMIICINRAVVQRLLAELSSIGDKTLFVKNK
jgi:hypothetical protein